MRFKLTNTNRGWRVIDTFHDDRIVAWGTYGECKFICRDLNAESEADL